MKYLTKTKTVYDFILKATATDGHLVKQAKAWCGSMEVPFVRFSPPITKVELNEVNDKKLIQMMWETHCFISANKDRIEKVAVLLKRENPPTSE